MEHDRLIIDEVDKQWKRLFNNVSIADLQSKELETRIKKDSMRTTLFNNIDEETIQLRAKVLIQFNDLWMRQRETLIKEDLTIKEGSIEDKFMQSKVLVFPQCINKFFEDRIRSLPTGGAANISVSRGKAALFCDSDKVDYEGKHTIFGQVFTQLETQRPNHEHFRQHGNT